MAALNRTTVYLEPSIHRALKVKAVTSDRGISELVNEAVRVSLREDEIDLRAVRERRREKGRPFEQFLRQLKREKLI